MDTLRTAIREFVGLFVDDGSLAVAILAVVAVAAIFLPLLPLSAPERSVALLGALLVILVENVCRTARRR